MHTGGVGASLSSVRRGDPMFREPLPRPRSLDLPPARLCRLPFVLAPAAAPGSSTGGVSTQLQMCNVVREISQKVAHESHRSTASVKG